MKEYPNKRDCEHGRQRGKCETCDLIELEEENQKLRAEVERLEKILRRYQSELLNPLIERARAAERRLAEVERERDEALKWVANFQNCSTKECMCGGDMNVTCGHCGCISTADYYAFPRAKELLNKFAIEHQIKELECIKPQCHIYAHKAIDDRIDQLRQQLGGE